MSGQLSLSPRIQRIGESATMRVAARASRLRAEGRDVVDLGPGEPDFPTPQHIKQAAIRAIQEDFTRYTEACGTLELRQAICQRHAADFGSSYSPTECAVCPGGKFAIFAALQCLLHPGDEVIIPAPYWVTYSEIVAYCGATPVFARTSPEEGFPITPALIERHFSPRTRAVILNSPCNPSGYVIPPADLAAIVELVSRRSVWVIVDECYAHLVYEGVPFSVGSLPAARSRVVIAGSLSKTYAMTGWRIGYALGPRPLIEAIARLESHSTSNPNSVAQKAAVAALLGPQDFVCRVREEYRRRRDFALELLRTIPGVRCQCPAGAFYLFPDVRDLLQATGIPTSCELSEVLLDRYEVATVPGEAFGEPGHLRLTFAVAMESLKRGIERMAQLAQQLS